ncbi:MAG: hypothetical protein LC118_02045 [Dehalococcoidia bacterium]|nr:hypothetical protein [Dehalococcoidia bacterium]
MANRQLRQLREALNALEAAPDALGSLDAARKVRERSEELEREWVEAARKAGFSWSRIGALYGMSKQGAQQRFRPVRKASPTRPRRPKAKQRSHSASLPGEPPAPSDENSPAD